MLDHLCICNFYILTCVVDVAGRFGTFLFPLRFSCNTYLSSLEGLKKLNVENHGLSFSSTIPRCILVSLWNDKIIFWVWSFSALMNSNNNFYSWASVLDQATTRITFNSIFFFSFLQSCNYFSKMEKQNS